MKIIYQMSIFGPLTLVGLDEYRKLRHIFRRRINTRSWHHSLEKPVCFAL